MTLAPVLVVDDDAAIRSMLAFALRDEGYDVGTAKNGRDAFEQILIQPVSLVLLDLQMPVMDGLTLVHCIHERGVRVPIVFMSAGGRARIAAQTEHVEGYLEKPFSLDDLYSIVSRVTTTNSAPQQ